MAKYIIQGGKKLRGEIKISGNKNSILPCLAATLLTQDKVTLRNVPNIRDVDVMIEILRSLGAKVERVEDKVVVKADNLHSTTLPKELVTKLRASILFVGPLLSREGRVEFCHPGGDVIGKRSIDDHIKGLELLGYEFNQDDRDYQGKRGDANLISTEIFQELASVTATENLIMASVLGKGVIKIKNCAQEPHVVDLSNLLTQMGASIEGIGSSILTITGVSNLSGTEFTIGPEHIEIGTYAIAAAITGGEVKMLNCSLKDLEPITNVLSRMGVKLVENSDGTVIAHSSNLQAIPHLRVNIWPGFPTDLISVAIVLATQANGVSLLHDWMFESRMYFVDKLISMGANIVIADPHRVIVSGPSKLKGRVVDTPDIRAGMALVLAALVAEGESVINRAELIERGYEDVVGNLSKLGAKISRED